MGLEIESTAMRMMTAFKLCDPRGAKVGEDGSAGVPVQEGTGQAALCARAHVIKRGSIDSVKAQPCVVFTFKLIWTFFPRKIILEEPVRLPTHQPARGQAQARFSDGSMWSCAALNKVKEESSDNRMVRSFIRSINEPNKEDIPVGNC